MAGQNMGNPAVVGLAGFGGTTLLLQFHNLGLCGAGVVFCMALAFGGLAQLIAGYQEFATGNNFGFCAFCSFGAFWISFGVVLLLLNLEGIPGQHFITDLKVTGADVGWYLVVWTIFAFILFIGSFAIHFAMFLTFLTLMLGLVGLDLVFLAGMGNLLHPAAWALVICALLAWYMMAHVIFLQLFGRDILPVGNPLVGKPQLAVKPA